jgi:F-type H+-transporting ATPase subunit b
MRRSLTAIFAFFFLTVLSQSSVYAQEDHPAGHEAGALAAENPTAVEHHDAAPVAEQAAGEEHGEAAAEHAEPAMAEEGHDGHAAADHDEHAAEHSGLVIDAMFGHGSHAIPLAGLPVIVFEKSGREVAQGVTGDKGSAVFEGLATGVYDVVIGPGIDSKGRKLKASKIEANVVNGSGHAHASMNKQFFTTKLLFFTINFILFAGVLFYFLRKPVATFFFQREREIRETLSRVEKLRQELDDKFSDYELKLKGIEQEVSGILDRARKEADNELAEMVALAEEQTGRLMKDAELLAANEVDNARRRLRSDAIEMAIKITEEKLQTKLDDATHKKLLDGYLERLEKV